ncbi:MAG: hypothetical protein LM591_02995 [Candidatus Korarchaeum sp.]|jgi:hypothetical protein|nr:hypothetical protein [Candidatus Korarchaeum sp.]
MTSLNKLTLAVLSIIAVILFILGYFGFHILPPLLYSLFPILPAIRLLFVRESVDESIARRASELAILIFPSVAVVVSLLLIVSGDPVIEGYVYGMFSTLVVVSAASDFESPRIRPRSSGDIIISLAGLLAIIVAIYLGGGYKYPSTLCLTNLTCSFLTILGPLIFLPSIYFYLAHTTFLRGSRTK